MSVEILTTVTEGFVAFPVRLAKYQEGALQLGHRWHLPHSFIFTVTQ
jgi:hypothetical protein